MLLVGSSQSKGPHQGHGCGRCGTVGFVLHPCDHSQSNERGQILWSDRKCGYPPGPSTDRSGQRRSFGRTRCRMGSGLLQGHAGNRLAAERDDALLRASGFRAREQNLLPGSTLGTKQSDPIGAFIPTNVLTSWQRHHAVRATETRDGVTDRMPGGLVIDEIVSGRLGQRATNNDACRNSDYSWEPSVLSEDVGAADLAECPRNIVSRSVATNSD